MTWWRRFFRRAHQDRDLAREIDAHIREHADDLVDRGMTREDARQQALLKFGNSTRWIEDSREVWLIPWLASLGQDLRYALRIVRREPVASASVVLILTLGIGLVTALFTVFNANVLRPWPVPDPSSIVILKALPGPDERFGLLSHPEYRYFREHAQSFSHLAANVPGGSAVGYRNGATFATRQSQYVTANYFETLRIGMAAGRGFLPEEEDYRAPRAVVILSEQLWRAYFESDPALIGTPIRVGDQLRTVVGVTERGFADVRGSFRVDLWLPLPTLAIALPGSGGSSWLRSFEDPHQGGARVFGRLKPGVTADQAQAELNVLSRQFRASVGMDSPGLVVGDTRPFTMNQENVRGQLTGMSVMFAALFLVLLLACANVSNLVLAKTVARRGEIAIRLSLGASRARIARQLLTETTLLSCIAGGMGLWLAVAVPRLMITLRGSPIANTDHLALDARVFLFALGMSLVAAVFATLGPALRVTRATEIRGGKMGRNSSNPRVRASLLALQIALSTVLLVAAGLLTRAISHAMTLDPGFAIAEVQELAPVLPANAQADALARIREAVETAGLPVAFSSLKPITSSRMEISVRHPEQPPEKSRRLVLRPVSANYFGLLRIPLLEGRTLDDRSAGRELVISQSAAALFWPNEDAIGKRLISSQGDKATSHDIVGVVADVPTTTLTETEPVIYQSTAWGGILLLRDLSPAVSERVKALVQAAVPGTTTVSQRLTEDVRDSLTSLIAGSWIAWMLGLLALLLATIGAFGVFASMVEERRQEIGTRMALGANGWHVIRLVLRGAMWPVAGGLAGGMALSLIVTPVLRNSLYGMSPFDPIAYLEIAAILVTAALLATWIPAARAAAVEPAITLRGD